MPRAPRRPSTRTLHGDVVTDDYAWMRQVDDPELLDYLAAENAWTEEQTGHLAGLRATLYDELARVLPEDDESAPWREGDWVYRLRRRAGEQYTVLARAPAAACADEQVVLDENALAAEAGAAYVDVGVRRVSPDGRLLAYSVDLDGSEVFTLRVRDLATGRDVPDTLSGTYYGLGWAADSASFLYTTLDAAYRPDTVHHHVLGQSQDRDVVVWHEPDRRFELEVHGTRSGDFVLLTAFSRDTSEIRLVSTSDPTRAPVVVQLRRTGLEYHVEHQRGPEGGRLLIVVDDTGPEFRLVTSPVRTPDRAHWQELLPHRPDVRVVSADAFGEHVVVTERQDGHLQLRVLDAAGQTVRVMRPEAPGEVVRLGRNEVYDVAAARVVREGWVRPAVDIDHDLRTGHETVAHEQRVLTEGDYRCEETWASAQDGTLVPLTLLTSGAAGASGASGPRPCLLYGYGSYEASLDPELWWEMRPLLDRGYVVAVAHVRGGGELGRAWWQQGRLLAKRTTFTDFVACARHLSASGITRPDLLAARGMSAGGLLMGAVMHLAPDAFGAVVAQVPFVDVVATMLDDTLPLTVGEWEEWGDPHLPEHYRYLRSYSPYENLPGPKRPALLVTASRHDPRVSVHEPAKWVAKLRAAESSSTDAPPLLLQTALGAAAHTGPSGRYDAWRDEAFLHAFVLDALGQSAR
ncbi:MAG: oligopeptidase [Actinomycetota bacterium]|nr:oligopeptidase [Actinomycetota bacterium]